MRETKMGFEVTLFYWVGWLVLISIMLIALICLFWLIFIFIRGSGRLFKLGSLLSFGMVSKKDNERLRKAIRILEQQEAEEEEKEKIQL